LLQDGFVSCDSLAAVIQKYGIEEKEYIDEHKNIMLLYSEKDTDKSILINGQIKFGKLHG